MTAPPRSRAFHVFSLITLLVGALLIWMGAAVTTTGSGMIFGDWPLSNGSVNPSGWLYFTPQLLEHGHRLLAESVGFLVLAMFLWQWELARLPWRTPVILVAAFIVLVSAVHAADAITKSIEDKTVTVASSFGLSASSLWGGAAVLFLAVLVWLFRGLAAPRWPLLLKLCASALVVVVMQAILGGLRVLEVSDPFGIAHGCLGQLFYCLLITVALAASAWWREGETLLPVRIHARLVGFTTTLFVVVSLQLLFGAIIRHTQRLGLAATDVLTTGGHLLPPPQPFAVFLIFMHKSWGSVVFCLALATAWIAHVSLKRQGWVSALPKLLALLPAIQVTLGVFVLLTGRRFWVTNFHVLNGLFILATAFVLMIIARRTRPRSGLLAREADAIAAQNASSPLQAGV